MRNNPEVTDMRNPDRHIEKVNVGDFVMWNSGIALPHEDPQAVLLNSLGLVVSKRNHYFYVIWYFHDPERQPIKYYLYDDYSQAIIKNYKRFYETFTP